MTAKSKSPRPAWDIMPRRKVSSGGARAGCAVALAEILPPEASAHPAARRPESGMRQRRPSGARCPRGRPPDPAKRV